MLNIQIVGASGTIAEVSDRGEIIIAPLAFDTPKFVNMNVDDQAFNFFPPRVGSQFVIKAIILTANRNVTTDCRVEIYESVAVDSTIISKSILQIEMLKNTVLPLTPLNILVSEGFWLNGKTDDNDVFATLTGYFIPVVA